MDTLIFTNPMLFLSTLSLRRATSALGGTTMPEVYFYPRSPCGERHECTSLAPKPKTFLSTLSLRRATLSFSAGREFDTISIHALLAESDGINRNVTNGQSHFYPRSPCGERQSSIEEVSKYVVISIHALLAESDQHRLNRLNLNRNFYPRSPCGERLDNIEITQAKRYFYPRSPCGERP